MSEPLPTGPPAFDFPIHGFCAHCGSFDRVELVRFVYGRARRGVSPRNAQEDARPLGRDEVLTCDGCARRLLRAGMARRLAAQGMQHVVPIVAVLGALVAGRLGSDERGAGDLLYVVAFGAGALALLLWRWRRQRSDTLAELCFEARREQLAESHGLAAAEIERYPDA